MAKHAPDNPAAAERQAPERQKLTRVLFIRVDDRFVDRLKTRMAEELEQRPRLTTTEFVREILEREL